MTTPMPDVVLAELCRDCETMDDVATRLADAGVTGLRGEPYECPVAWWMHRYLPDYMVSVEGTGIICVSAEGDRTWLPTPVLIDDFVAEFDAGNYPELEARPTS